MTADIRILTPDDWEVFAAIRLEALKNNPGAFSSNYEAESHYTKQQWQNWLSQCVFGLWDDNSIIGIISVVTYRDDPEGKTGIICAVYIKPAYRAKGLSRLLYQACIEQAARHLSWKKVIVSHRADNEVSRGAILRQGFVMTHHTSRTWPDGASFGEVCYQLDLDQVRKKNPYAA